jgi:hypothetical protein
VDVATTVQIVTAASNIIFAGVVGIGYYLLIRVSRETLDEMRETRVAGGRPQIIVEADHSRLPIVDVVVRNVGGGAARDIEFEFSSPMVSSTGFVLSDLNYFRAGMNFLETGAEVRSYWDTFDDLESTLRQSGTERGIAVTVRYLDLAGASYEDVWAINPLLYEGETITGYEGMNNLVEVAGRISDNVEALTRSQPAASGDERREA